MTQISSEQTGAQNEAVELTESERHRLLAARQRRLVVDVLADRAGPVDLEALASTVATLEADSATATSEATAQVEMHLHHAHLPMLDDAGVLDYDPEANRVVGWQLPDQLL